jgi:hypothetical protein
MHHPGLALGGRTAAGFAKRRGFHVSGNCCEMGQNTGHFGKISVNLMPNTSFIE